MLIKCTTKGCFAESEAKYDVKNDIVVCEACGNKIENITIYIKKALKDAGQILRSRKLEPFQAYCTTCKANKSLFMESGRAYCKECNTQVHISAAFSNGLKSYLQSEEEAKAKETTEEAKETKEEVKEVKEEVKKVKRAKKAVKEVKE